MKETNEINDLFDVCLSAEPFQLEPVTQAWPERCAKHPKLKRFVGHEHVVEPQYVASGEEGTVFRFNYHGQDLCLKLFKEWKYAGFSLVNEKRQKHLGPFSNECRAFARLCDVQKYGTFAVRCHGWMHLTDTKLAEFIAVDETEIPPKYTNWAIVKDFISDKPGPKDIDTIIGNIQIAKRARLLPGDVKPDNYRRSFFVDLGDTRTLPTPFSSRFEFNHFYESGCKDLENKDWLR